MRALRILHISDLHERAPFDAMPSDRRFKIAWDARQRGQVLGPRFADALEEIAKPGIDIVCFTGDLADWGHPTEYEKATMRIDQILRTVGVPRERFFAVPGNHDVQRGTEAEAWCGIRNWLATTHDGGGLGRWFLGVHKAPPGLDENWREKVLSRTAAFWSWYEAFRGKVPGREEIPLGYRETFARGAISDFDEVVHIVGLDSAWLCGGNDDQGAILVTQEQTEAHIRDGEHALKGVRIGLVHHPLDHLADHHPVRRLLGDDGVDLLLHGHQHAPLALLASEPGARLRILASGCLMEGDLGRGWANGFQLVEVESNGLSGCVHFKKWSPEGRFWVAGSDIYRDAHDGVLRWSAKETPLKDQNEPNQRYATNASPEQSSVILRMEGVRMVSTSEIRAALLRYGRQWPEVVIQWPPSLTELIDGLKNGLRGRLSLPGAESFAISVPNALESAATKRAQTCQKIPELLWRARALSDDYLVTILKNYLLFANYQCHVDLAHFSSWTGLRPWSVPIEWQPIQYDPKGLVLAQLMGARLEEGGLCSGRLRVAEGMKIYTDNGSPGMYIQGTNEILRNPSRVDICAWFIPQLEYYSPWCNLPEAYQLENWYVDKVLNSQGLESE